MKQLTKLLTLIACFAVVTSTALTAADEQTPEQQAEAAIQAELPEGVTIASATDTQLAVAIRKAAKTIGNNPAVLAALKTKSVSLGFTVKEGQTGWTLIKEDELGGEDIILEILENIQDENPSPTGDN